jgi:two-component system nitrate/nitrite response regulator NarL
MPKHAHSPNGRIRVLVAEATQMAGQLIAGALQRCRHQFDVVAFPCTASDAIRELEECRPHVALISMHLQDGPMSGFKLLHQMQASQIKTPAVILLDSCERDVVIDSFCGGARGVFSRSQPLRALSKCIRLVHQGQIWIGNGELEYLLDLVAHSRLLLLARNGETTLFTGREKQIVKLVAEGMKNKEIAAELSVSEHTVRNYLFRIFEKLGISSRVELVLYALSWPE